MPACRRHLARLILASALAALGGTSALQAAPAADKKSGSSGLGVQGSVELGLKGFFDFDGNDDSAAYLDLTLGYVLAPRIEVGITALQGTKQDGERGTVSVFSEYDLTAFGAYVPFAGFSVGHTAPPRDSTDGKDGRLVSLYAGLAVALNPSCALALRLADDFADKAVLGQAGQRKRNERKADLGFRLFF